MNDKWRDADKDEQIFGSLIIKIAVWVGQKQLDNLGEGYLEYLDMSLIIMCRTFIDLQLKNELLQITRCTVRPHSDAQWMSTSHLWCIYDICIILRA